MANGIFALELCTFAKDLPTLLRSGVELTGKYWKSNARTGRIKISTLSSGPESKEPVLHYEHRGLSDHIDIGTHTGFIGRVSR